MYSIAKTCFTSHAVIRDGERGRGCGSRCSLGRISWLSADLINERRRRRCTRRRLCCNPIFRKMETFSLGTYMRRIRVTICKFNYTSRICQLTFMLVCKWIKIRIHAPNTRIYPYSFRKCSQFTQRACINLLFPIGHTHTHTHTCVVGSKTFNCY